MTGAARQLARVDIGPISATDALHDVPKDRWPELMRARRRFAEVNIERDCRFLLEFCLDCDVMFEVLGFADPRSMIVDGLGLREAELAVITEWLRWNPQDEALPLETAKVMALRSHGGDRRSEDQADNISLKSEHGTGRDYTIARLRRDRPDLAERVEAGELSAHAAAIEAGFRHRRTPFEIITRLITKLDAAERARLVEILEEAETEGQRLKETFT